MSSFLPRLLLRRLTIIASFVLLALSACGRPTVTTIDVSSDESRLDKDAIRDGSDQDVANSASATTTPVVADPPVSRSVRVDAEVEPNKMRPGEHATLQVRLRMSPGWHIKPLDSKTGFVRPTTIELELPDGIEARGEWQFPQSDLILVGHGQEQGYQGEVLFRRELSIDDQLPAGTVEVVCHVKYQACTGELCERPSDITLRRVMVIASE